MTVEAKLRVVPLLDAAIAALRSLRNETAAAGTAAEQANRKGDFSKMRDGAAQAGAQISMMYRQLLAFLGLQQGAQAVATIARWTDQYTSLNARLRQVSGSQEAFNQNLALGRQLAQQYNQPLNETLTLYTRILGAIKPLGGGTREAAVATESLLAALKINGSSAAESASAILQYSQALGSGRLSGEEFNAIAEAAPRLLDALAKGLGKGRFELKALAEQGQLTTSAIVGALAKSLPELQRQAAAIPTTIGGAYQQLVDSLQQYIGKQTEANGTARTAIGILKALADNINLVVIALTVLASAALFAGVARLINLIIGLGAAGATAAVGAGVVGKAFAALAAIVGGPVGLVVTVLALAAAWLAVSSAKKKVAERTLETARSERDAVKGEIEDLQKNGGFQYYEKMVLAKQKLRKLDAEVEEFERYANGAFRGKRTEGGNGLEDPASIKKFEDEHKLRSDIVKKYADERTTYSIAKDKAIEKARAEGNDQLVLKLTREKSAYISEQNRSEREALKQFDTRDALTRLAQAKTLYDKDLDLLIDATQRERQVLQERFDEGLVGLQEYLAEKGRLQDLEAGKEIARVRAQLVEEQRAVDANIKREKSAKDANAKEQFKEAIEQGQQKVAQLDAELTKKERERVDNARALTTEARNLTRELQLQAIAIDAENKQIRGIDTDADIRRRVLAQRAQERQAFVARGGDAGAFDQNTELRIQLQQYALLQRRLETVRGSLAQEEAAIRIEQEAGQITAEDAETRILNLRRAQLPVIQDIVKALTASGSGLGPEERLAAQRAQNETTQLGDMRTELQRTLTTTGKNGISQFFLDIATGAETAGGALRKMLGGFANQMLQLISQRLGAKLFESFGLGKVVDTAATYISSAFGFHAGGVVGSAGASFTRSIALPPGMLNLVPRFHSGGIAGLGPRERLGVLLDDEEVITRDDPRHAWNGGGGGAGGVQINSNVSVNGAQGDKRDQERAAADLDRIINGAIGQWAIRESRPGGVLARG